MKKLIAAGILLVFALAGQAQKTINDPNAESRKVGGFSGVSVSGGIDLYLSHGDEAVAVSASTTEYRDQIKTEIQGGILKIWFDGNRIKNIFSGTSMKLKAYVSFNTLNSLSATGGCDVMIEGTLKTPTLRMNLTGGCDFEGRVDVDDLFVKQTGGCDVKIAGMARKLTIEAVGGSDFKGYDLVAEVCSAEAVGGSDIEITANKELSAKATGASDISYRGKPQIRESKSSGASSISSKS